MPSSHNPVSAIKDRLTAGREKARRQHDSGVPGIQVCAQLTDLLDSVILDLYQEALDEIGDPELPKLMCLVAHGGYGRRDVAPFSDVDLMLLHAAGAEDRVAPLARHLTLRIYDTGLTLGFSLRNAKQACQLAARDAPIFTSLAESRYLTGSVQLFTKYMSRFRRSAQRRQRAIIDAIQLARREERSQYGETVYLLRPNVKRSRGGLREIQMLRWVGFARYGETDPETLQRLGVLHKSDRKTLRDASEFLLRVRNELHFQAGKSQDMLEKSEQLRIAEKLEYAESEAVLPVEQFMRDYFDLTGQVRYITAQFVESAKPSSAVHSFLGPLVVRRAGNEFQIGTRYVRATKVGLEKLKGDLSNILRLMELANFEHKRIHNETWKAIREDMMDREEIEYSGAAAERFLALIAQPGQLGDQLRKLHQLRVLEKFVPPVKHARCLMQFNEYHKYTVDEHSLRAVEAATSFLNEDSSVGRAYGKLNSKRTLHLALLMHDLGKGFAEDHSIVGERLALETGPLLGLPQEETETIAFLILKHLRMAHVALRENLYDESVIIRFAVEVGSAHMLRMLFVLTCADIDAVGPGVLNQWKLELLTELYYRTRRLLAEDDSTEDWIAQRRDQIRGAARIGDNSDWWDRQLDALPLGLMSGREPVVIADDLTRLQGIERDQLAAWGTFHPERDAVEYKIAAHSNVAEGIFHKLTGALSAKGLQILSAEIYTLADNLVLDRFYVEDLDYRGESTPERLDEVSRALCTAAKSDSNEAPSFGRRWSGSTSEQNIEDLPVRVRFDNGTSDSHTIVTVFAYDRRGLLFSITRCLFEQGLSVHAAKIATHYDQVVDVFYVSDRQGAKVEHVDRLDQIRDSLFQAIEANDEE
ncbi:MAG: [protein-PII] uridylyltransferase [Pirellulaceae bacterium]|jgi:[protein-PII] uridylyltransferase|nr:[protein-PII] uridylyltransferase [Pirellulaceae bacterium]MDP7019198.1 [protein-PII] uridylyltransferase [Pirellulaceae bacterium]